MSALSEKRLFKVLCPLKRKDGKTYWAKVGIGFRNKDDSIGILLDLLPTNNKLHVREYDEDDRSERDPNAPRRGGEPRMGGLSAGLPPPSPDLELDDMPF